MRETNMDDYMGCRGYEKCRDWYGLIVVPEPEPEVEPEPELIEVPEKIKKPRKPRTPKVKPDNTIKLADRTCTICGKEFTFPNKLRRHQTSMSCYTIIPKVEPLEEEESVIEEIKEQPVFACTSCTSCTSCTYTTNLKFNFNRHAKTCKAKPKKQSITKVMEDLRQQIINLTNIVTNK
jgi:hypothetical protein